jgi:anti-sigma factor (TIGR02949 family)
MPRASPPKSPRTMRECREVIDLLTEYLEGDLAPAESRRLAAHLAGCDACSEFLKSLRTVRAAAKTPVAEAVPEDCRRALRTFLKAGLRRPPPRRRS